MSISQRLSLMVLCCFGLLLPSCGNQPASLDTNNSGSPSRTLPKVASAKSLSRHYVEVTFEKPATVDSLAVDDFAISKADSGTSLEVTDTWLHEDGTRAVLTTAPQEEISYRLVQRVPSEPSGTTDGTPEVLFAGLTGNEPCLQTAIALSNTSLLLTFDVGMDTVTTTTMGYYDVSNPDLKLISAVLDNINNRTLTVTTEAQKDVLYSLKVTNVKTRITFLIIDPRCSATTFYGMPPVDVTGPKVTAAVSTSKSSVLVSFSEPMDVGTADPINFSISPNLSVTGAELTNQGTQVLLTTTAQVPDREYTVTTQNVRDKAHNPLQVAFNTATFRGTARELFLASAVALSNTTVLVTYSEPPDLNTALNKQFYHIDDPDGEVDVDIVINSIAADVDPRAVILTTTPQQNLFYMLRVSNIRAIRDNFLIDPARSATGFFGIPVQDSLGPRLLTAESASNTSVLLKFNEPLDPDAADPINFAITCAGCEDTNLLVLDASITKHNTQMYLVTHPQEADVTYTVQATNTNGQFTDLSNNRNPLNAAFSTATFGFAGQPSLEPSLVLPRVIGAASLGNTSVMVTFNKPMGDSALVAANYSILQKGNDPGIGPLLVFDKACNAASDNAGAYCLSSADCPNGACVPNLPTFRNADRTAVQLTTSSQVDVSYIVTVVNVRDLQGNQLAPKEILVDPTTAEFRGIAPNSIEEQIDTDGDGFADWFETAGWMIVVELANGTQKIAFVTSNPFNPDTDGDGLTDGEENAHNWDPRTNDTDADLLDDYTEFNLLFSDPADQDSDNDGNDDYTEVTFFFTSPIDADTDGDGLDDSTEIERGNRDPRIADLPDPGIEIGEVALQLDTRFQYTDTQGESQSFSKSNSSTLSQSESRTFSTSDQSTTEHAINASAEYGLEATKGANSQVTNSFKASLAYGYTRGNTFTSSQESSQETQQEYQQSFTSGVQRDVTQEITRTVEGASVQLLVSINNGGDIPFTVRNLQITGLMQDPFNRKKFVPVATLLPASQLEGGEPLEVFLGPFIPSRGPFIFKNSEVFPSLVEDLMKNPRGLLFTVANFDIEDEAGRNFAFKSQEVNDKTAGLIIDYGNGTVERYRIATYSQFDDTGEQTGLSMAYALQNILGLQKNQAVNAITVGANGCGETWAVGNDIQVTSPLCFPVEVEGKIIDPGPNGVLDSTPAGDDERIGNSIFDGGDGCAHTRASRDDIQVVPGDCQVAAPNGIMVLPGIDNTFQTTPDGDDQLATVTGYGTQDLGVCDGNTAKRILKGPNAQFDSVAGGDDVVVSNTSIQPGANGILETVPKGDDLLVGPGADCSSDADCPSGVCRFIEALVRVKGVQNITAERRFWIILTDVDVPPGTPFDEINLRAGQTFSLAYVQDKDDDGLIAHEEFLYGSSDNDVNSDGCPLGDGAVGCDENVFDFDTVHDFEEVKQGWSVQVEGRSSYVSYPNPIQPDTDIDRLFDDEEQTLGTDPGKQDTDDDEISDFDEVEGYDILRRDDALIRRVVPYQSAYIGPGPNAMLDTTNIVDDDDASVHALNFNIITAGDDGEIDSIPDGDDEFVETHYIIDGGNAVPESQATGDDIQVGASPVATTTVTVTFERYSAGGNACDSLYPGQMLFDLRVRKNVDTVIGEFQQEPTVDTFAVHYFDGVIVAGNNQDADTTAAGDDVQVVVVGSSPETGDVVITPGENGILETTPAGDDQVRGPDNGGNSFVVALDPGDSISLSGSVRENDAVCDVDTRRAVIESGQVIVEPLTGGNGTANQVILIGDDVLEVATGNAVQPGQVIVSPGPDGILQSGPGGDDVRPTGNGFADTAAVAGDFQAIPLANVASPGQIVVDCGADGEPEMGMAAAVPGICEAVIRRITLGDGTADTVKAGDDIQVKAFDAPVVVGDVIVRAGPNGQIDTVPAGSDEDIVDVRAPVACAAVITNAAGGGNGIAETTASGDDVQVIAVGAAAGSNAIVINPGPNMVINSTVATQVVRRAAAGNVTTTAAGDDIQLKPFNSAVAANTIVVAPGPNGVINSTAGSGESVVAADDVLVPRSVPANENCALCPLGTCIYDCTLCPTGSCTGDDALLVRQSGDPCGDGLCPCGNCLDNFTSTWNLTSKTFTLPELEAAAGEGGTFTTDFDDGPGCFGSAVLRAHIAVTAGASVPSGSVLVMSGPNGVLDTEPHGDDVVGAPHLRKYATDPLNRDTDGDTLFDGAEAVLGANPNDPLDASKFRDNDLDGLANIEETNGWFIGYVDPVNGLQCRTTPGTFISVADEFNPPAQCVFVSPDRFEPDSDFDGLPDMLERLIRSDPNNYDTDGDGLLDYDEFNGDSRFSINIVVFREFERRCAAAPRCSFTQLEDASGTSAVLADTDQDGRSDWAELTESWVINPCDALTNEQIPSVVFSSPLSADADSDGVLDGIELSQATDPNDPDTDNDGKVDNSAIDGQPDGCGKVITISFVSYAVTDDCDSGGDGEWQFDFTVAQGQNYFYFSQDNDDLDDNRTHTFSTNQAVFTLRPGESFSISGTALENDDSDDEIWNFSRTYYYESLPATPIGIGPTPGEADDNCFDSHSLSVSITVTGA